ncbi:MAG: UDP-N-acetylmuramoyl-tripeptide--D-alanyl-D-alanine ligase [Bacteroidales bacterium]
MSNIESIYNKFLSSKGVTTDSRERREGTLFFALQGESFDGNQFAADALKNGAEWAVVDNPKVVEDERYILVEDSLKTLQQLAHRHRREFSIPILALTGSNGKTTTKELIAAVLSTKYRVLYPSGSFNNHIGVPLTLLGLNSGHEVAVIEVGSSAPGEIASLLSIIEPTLGLITNIGKAHLLGFNSIEGVIAEKGELYNSIEKRGGTLFYNVEDPTLAKMLSSKEGVEKIAYGLALWGLKIVTPQKGGVFLTVELEDGSTIHTKFVGEYNAINILAALTVGRHLGCTLQNSIGAIERYTPSNMRSQYIGADKNTIILDAYNANPVSMRLSIESFSKIESNKKGVILGDMRELGSGSAIEHKSLLESIKKLNFNPIILVGNEMVKASKDDPYFAERGRSFRSVESLVEWLKESPIEGRVLLIKGSRGIELERALPLLT